MIGAVIATEQRIANTLAEKVVVNMSDVTKPSIDVKAIVESGNTSRMIMQGEKQASTKKSKFQNDVRLCRKTIVSFCYGGFRRR